MRDVPGALCLLYEAGAMQVLIDAGLKFLRGGQAVPSACRDAAVLTASALFQLAEELTKPGTVCCAHGCFFRRGCVVGSCARTHA